MNAGDIVFTPPRVYQKPDGTPHRVAIYGRAAPDAELRVVCELRDPAPGDLANFERIARAPRVIAAAREMLQELYALRDAGYFRAQPTDTASLSISIVSFENAVRAYDAEEQ